MLLLENRPQFFLWLLALNRIGAAVVPVNPDLRQAELTYMIGHAEPVLAVVLAEPLEGTARRGERCGLI
jgi:acyl-CoA synthetase (AMP-forming)/AMP-acid ligase II